MRTRISRNGKQQVLLGVWIDKSVYDELESTAKNRESTVADVTRILLAQSVEKERRRPDAEQILKNLLNLQEAEREHLREQLQGSRRRKALHLKALQASNTAKSALKVNNAVKNTAGA